MNRRVVVTGIGAVTPVGNDVDTMWTNLINGVHGIGQITRFDTSEYAVHIGAEVKDYDPLLYMSKAEVRKADLNVKFAMGAAVQAVEDSGIEGHFDPDRTGVYVGSGIGGIGTFEDTYERLMTKGPRFVSPYFIPMMIPNMAAGTIAIKYGMRGPALPAVSACASGSNAIGEALRAIRHGYLDVMITGGTEATITKSSLAGFINMQAVSRSEDADLASLPFDNRRDGFVMGEGSGILVLEEYEHAVKRGAKIYAELTGYGSTCDAHHMTAPDPEAVGGSLAIKQAYAENGECDMDKLYINAHGTGTPLNDRSETVAIKKAFGEEDAHKITISSTKSMTGHCLGAAGAIEAITCIKAINEGIVPPTIGLTEPDPDCDLDYTPLKARKMDIDTAISSSLGFGGHNACLAFRKVK